MTTEPQRFAESATTGIDLIAVERKRQIEAEGWTAEHDDEHAPDALVHAARWYEFVGRVPLGRRTSPSLPSWPWETGWWKPSSDPIRNLVKAGALWQAEADRVERAMALPRRRSTDGSLSLLIGRQRWTLVSRDQCAIWIDEALAHFDGSRADG